MTKHGEKELKISIVLLICFFTLILIGKQADKKLAQVDSNNIVHQKSSKDYKKLQSSRATPSNEADKGPGGGGAELLQEVEGGGAGGKGEQGSDQTDAGNANQKDSQPEEPHAADGNGNGEAATAEKKEENGGGGGGAVEQQVLGGGAENAPLHNNDIPDDVQFSIVMLTYKAPKSLAATVSSMIEAGLLANKMLEEVIIYFQSMNKAQDVALVQHILKKFPAELVNVNVRVVGSEENLPVARATFKALRMVKTKYVMYVETDRPIYRFDTQNKRKTQTMVSRTIADALSFLETGKADVFRLQLYAGPGIGAGSSAEQLPLNTYGREDTHATCLAAPSFPPSVCATAKAKKGPVFNTAYCKHWKKFIRPKPQKDLCDSFCFLDWAMTQDPGQYPNIADAVVTRYIDGVAVKGGKHLASHPNEDRGEGESGGDGEPSSTGGNHSLVVCMTSGECNWTNQPTMYRKDWYLENIAAPCEQNKKKCIGHPGRNSAVLQEQFFVKNDAHWKMHKHKVCVTQGLFFHFEVDNREK